MCDGRRAECVARLRKQRERHRPFPPLFEEAPSTRGTCENELVEVIGAGDVFSFAPVRSLVVQVCCERGLYLKNSFVLPIKVVCCVVVPLFVLLAPWSAGGGDREDVALSYVYANSGCVASWLCVL